jgi:type II secretory pathway pseudopilin PulG
VFTCPECEQAINQASAVCPYCGSDVTNAPDGSEFANVGLQNKKIKPSRIVILLGVLLAILAGTAWFALPWKISSTKLEAEGRARQALAAIQQTLAGYQNSEDGFPSSLESLGDRVRFEAERAQAVHYTIQYTAGKGDASGHLKSYTLTARAGNFGYMNFYTDESGVLRGTSENRAATVQDPPIKPEI